MPSREREVITTRLLHAPRESVFAAWTDPNILTLWWGPKGFRNTFSEFNPVPGGFWRFIMSAPDGTDYRNESRFVEIVPPERIVFDHLSGHTFRVTATFKEQGSGTLLTWSMMFETPEEYEQSKSVVIPGNEENLDRLEVVLSSMKKAQ
jgi:uncharacterized protein YndB with AHSA1/START domain